jgi:pyruvate/2-oxoglutarate dehydrogenase complex dihydrolipoamide dehydrogenase (E3) component
MKKFDSIVIGSGQAGTPLVFKLANAGQKVAFIEEKHLGGTCLNDGCTPTKAYVASARRMWDAQNGDALGIYIPEGAKVDMKKVKARKDALIKKSVDGIADGLEKNENISFFEGTAEFLGYKEVQINKERVTAENIYINVGARAKVTNEFKDVDFLTNTSILELEEVPEHLVVIGASYIGLEFGQMFKRFGSKVTIIEQGDQIIHHEDKEVSDTIQKFMKEEGVDFRLDSKCIGAWQDQKGIHVSLNCGNVKEVIKASHLLLAIGRTSNADKLNLEKTGVKIDEHSFIKVNDYLETNVPGIFALGDCNGKGAFTHTAYNDYEIVAQNKFDGKDRKVSDRIVTYGLFVDPPLGRVGMTEKQAEDLGYSVKVARQNMDRVSRAKEKAETNGFMSVIIDTDTDKILGASVLGVGGDEIISSFINIMYANQPYTVIRDSIHPHPTVSELIPTMLEAI